jgi:ribosomal protein S27E
MSDDEPEFIISVRVRDCRVPPVPSKRVRCADCDAWLWLSAIVAAAISPDIKPLCLSCGDALAKSKGGEIVPVIPDAVKDEFAAFVARGGRDERAN